jgi:hypothetical protein
MVITIKYYIKITMSCIFLLLLDYSKRYSSSIKLYKPTLKLLKII